MNYEISVMQEYHFKRTTTVETTRAYSVFAHSLQDAEIKASCGPDSHVENKEGVTLMGQLRKETSSCKQISKHIAKSIVTEAQKSVL